MLLHKVPEGFKNLDLAVTSARLMEIAMEGLDRLPDCFRGAELDVVLRRFYEHFTARRRVPADDLLDAVQSRGGQVENSGARIGFSVFAELERKWNDIANGREINT
jgi:hypothetical protein